MTEFCIEHPIVALLMVWAICHMIYKSVHIIVLKKPYEKETESD